MGLLRRSFHSLLAMTEFRNDGILEFFVMISSGQAGDDIVGNSKFEFKVKIKGAALECPLCAADRI